MPRVSCLMCPVRVCLHYVQSKEHPYIVYEFNEATYRQMVYRGKKERPLPAEFHLSPPAAQPTRVKREWD